MKPKLRDQKRVVVIRRSGTTSVLLWEVAVRVPGAGVRIVLKSIRSSYRFLTEKPSSGIVTCNK